jgi:hypothetical protein
MGADDRIEAASKALKAAIDKSNTAVRERDAERRQRRRAQSRPAGALLVSLLGIETEAADSLRGELEAAQRGEAVLTSELIQRAQAAASTPEVLARKRDHEARRAAAILRAALTDLNYQVGDDFETCFAGGGETLLHKPATDRAWQDHACQMTIDPDTHAVDLRIVRFSDNPEATRDDRGRASRTTMVRRRVQADG